MWPLLERRYQQGKKTTPIEEKPADLTQDMQFYWDSFVALSMTRRYDQNIPLRINFSEINAYLNILGNPVSDAQLFLDVILMIDSEFLDILAKRRNEENEKSKPSNKRKRKRDVQSNHSDSN